MGEIAATGRQRRTAILRDAWVNLGGKADAKYRESVLTTHRAKLAAGVYAVDPILRDRNPADLAFEDFARERWLTGDADAIHGELDAWEKQFGIEFVLIRIRSRGLPSHEDTLEQLRAFGELVIAPRASRPGGTV
jgi:hypothetical protein